MTEKITVGADQLEEMFEHPALRGISRLSERMSVIEEGARDNKGRLNPVVARVAHALLKNRLTQCAPFGAQILKEAAMEARIEHKLGRKLSHQERFKMGFFSAAIDEATLQAKTRA